MKTRKLHKNTIIQHAAGRGYDHLYKWTGTTLIDTICGIELRTTKNGLFCICKDNVVLGSNRLPANTEQVQKWKNKLPNWLKENEEIVTECVERTLSRYNKFGTEPFNN